MVPSVSGGRRGRRLSGATPRPSVRFPCSKHTDLKLGLLIGSVYDQTRFIDHFYLFPFYWPLFLCFSPVSCDAKTLTIFLVGFSSSCVSRLLTPSLLFPLTQSNFSLQVLQFFEVFSFYLGLTDCQRQDLLPLILGAPQGRSGSTFDRLP